MKRLCVGFAILGIFGSLGLVCLVNCGLIFGLGDMDQYPYRFPFYLLTGGAAFLICTLTACWQYRQWKNSAGPALLKLLLGTVITLAVFIPCFFLWIQIDNQI